MYENGFIGESKLIYKKLKLNFYQALTETEYCCVCFERYNLISVEDCTNSDQWGKSHKIADILKSLFHGDVSDVFTSRLICQKCLIDAENSFKFINHAQKTMEYFDLYTKQLDKFIDDMTTNMQEVSYENAVFLLTDPVDESMKIDYFSDDSDSLIDSDNPSNLKCIKCKHNNCQHFTYLEWFVAQKEKGLRLVECLDCPFKCASKINYVKHVDNEHLNVSVACHVCNLSFDSQLALKSHLESYHDGNRCHFCNAEFLSRMHLKKHSKLCSLNSDKYVCDQCQKTCKTKSEIRSHLRTHTMLQRKYVCPYCNKIFYSLKLKHRHLKEHSSKEKPYCCTCRLKFDTEQEFRSHLKTNEHAAKDSTFVKKLSCKECDYQTVSLNGLEAHINRYHLKIAPYKCKICSKEFTSPVKLEQHLQRHTGVKTHQCELCGKYFCGHTALKKHKRRLHGGVNPYDCQVCKEKFPDVKTRNAHLSASHEKNVKCPLCTNTYYTLGVMRIHFKSVHWKDKSQVFDVHKVPGLKVEDYDLFRDRRMLVL